MPPTNKEFQKPSFSWLFSSYRLIQFNMNSNDKVIEYFKMIQLLDTLQLIFNDCKDYK